MQLETHLSLLIVMSIAAMLVLALGLVLFVVQYQRKTIAHQLEVKKLNDAQQLELLKASIQSEEKERTRIAGELHDDVAATLSSVRLFLYKPPGTEYSDNILAQAKTLLDQSITKIRDISHKLQPAALQTMGLERSLAGLIETLGKSGQVATSFISNNTLPREHEDVELAAYRISQELINNILKHAGATSIVLETDATDEELCFTFTYNGAGLTQEMYEDQIYKTGSTGLKNIINRLKSVKGSVSYGKSEQHLYYIRLKIPVATK